MKKPSFLTPPRSLKPLSPKDALDLDSLIGGCAYLQRIDHPDAARANAQALQDLANGASGLALVSGRKAKRNLPLRSA